MSDPSNDDPRYFEDFMDPDDELPSSVEQFPDDEWWDHPTWSKKRRDEVQREEDEMFRDGM